MKKILISLIILLLTGCSATYTLDLNSDEFKESLSLVGDNDYTAEAINGEYNNLTQAINGQDFNPYEKDKQEGVEYYNKSLIENGINYNYSFNKNNYTQSNIIASCYQHVYIKEVDDTILLSTSNEFFCFDYYQELDSVTIKINIKNKVVGSNADNIKGNIYTWNLKKSEYKNSPIMISYKKNEIKENIEILKIIIPIILIISAIGVVVIIRYKKSNEI